MADDTIEIEYQLTIDDHAEFYVTFASDRPVGYLVTKFFFTIFIVMLLGMLIFFGGVFVIMLYIEGGDFAKVVEIITRNPPLPKFRWELLLIIIICCLYDVFPSKKKRFLNVLSDFKRRYNTGKNVLLTAPSRLTISSNSIKGSCDYSQSEINWFGIEKVENNEKGLCLFTSVVSGIFIPARFFKSEDERQRIFEQCQKWFLEAQGETADA